MKRIWAMALVVMMIFSMAPGALAASEYYSGSLTVGGRVKATVAPTAAPTPAPEAQEPAAEDEPADDVEPAADPEESTQPDEAVEETPAPSAEPEETPVESEWPRPAVVNKTGEEKVVNIRMEPNAEATRVGRATDGDLLTVYGERKGWMNVETADGVCGWMSGKFVSFDIPETDPVAEPTAEPVAEPTAEPVAEPTAEPVAEPVAEPTTEPETEPVVEPTAEPETEPVVEPSTEPETEATVEPTAEPEVTEEPTDGLESDEEAFEPIEGLVVNNDADVRLEGDGLSEILVTIDAETPVTVIGIEGDWVKIMVDGVVGYVYIDDIESIRDVEGVLPEPTPAPSAAPDETPAPNLKVTIFSSRRTVMTPGETVVLTSKLEGFEGYEIKYQWECDKGDGFEDIEGANGDSYSYAASVETLAYDWRLTVYYR